MSEEKRNTLKEAKTVLSLALMGACVQRMHAAYADDQIDPSLKLVDQATLINICQVFEFGIRAGDDFLTVTETIRKSIFDNQGN